MRKNFLLLTVFLFAIASTNGQSLQRVNLQDVQRDTQASRANSAVAMEMQAAELQAMPVQIGMDMDIHAGEMRNALQGQARLARAEQRETNQIGVNIADGPLRAPTATTVLSQGFEGTTGTNIPAGWARQGSLGTGAITATANGQWITTGTTTRGTRSALINLNGAGNVANWGYLWSPDFALAAGTTYEVEFWLHWGAGTGSSHVDNLIVSLVKTELGGEDDVVIADIEIGAFQGMLTMPQATWTRFSFSVTPEVAGNDFYLEILGANVNAFTTATSRGGHLRIDDIRISEMQVIDCSTPLSAPYGEGFEGTSGNSLPDCWERTGATVTGATTANAWNVVSSGQSIFGISRNARSGTRMMASLAWGVTTPVNAWLFTPAIEVEAGKTYKISFWYMIPAVNAGAPVPANSFRVRVGTGQSEAEMTTTLFTTSNNAGEWTLVEANYTATASGVIYVGFNDFSPPASPGNGFVVFLDDISVEEAVANELEVIANFPYTQIPISQAITPTARVRNPGAAAQTNVVLSATLNGNNLGTSAPHASLASLASVNLSITPAVNAVLGGNNLVYSVNSAEGATDEVARAFVGTEDTFAVDLATAASQPAGIPAGWIFGNIFEVTTATYMLQAYIGFGATATGNHTIQLYAMTGDLQTASTPIFTQPFTASAGFVAIDVPPTALSPGRYFLAINTPAGASVLHDGVANPTAASFNRNAAGALGGVTLGGVNVALAVRMVIGELAENDAAITAIISPVSGIGLTNAESVTATIKNYGTNAITSLGLELTVNGTVVATETFTGNIASGASVDYTFTATADLSAAGSHTISVRAILTGDENPANDSYSITVRNILPISTFPWLEDFNADVFPPEDWLTSHTGPATGSWRRAAHAPQHDGAFAYRPDVQGNNQQSLLVTPPISLPADKALELSFMSYIEDPEYYAASGVFISTDLENFTLLHFIDGDDVAEEWRKIVVSLDEYKGEMVFIAFVYQGNWSHAWRVDDVMVDFPLVVETLSPADEAVNVALNEPVTVTFNKDITAVDLSGITFSPSVAGVVPSVDGAVLTIAHDEFALNTEYTVTVPAGAVVGLNEEITWSFTTRKTAVGLPTNELESLAIYPNPVQNRLFIQSPTTVNRVEIYNLLGSLVKTVENNVQQISVSDMTSGIYMIRIMTDEGTITQRFVKE